MWLKRRFGFEMKRLAIKLINGFENQGFDDLQAAVLTGLPSRENFFLVTAADRTATELQQQDPGRY
jgi:hypothetical protein